MLLFSLVNSVSALYIGINEGHTSSTVTYGQNQYYESEWDYALPLSGYATSFYLACRDSQQVAFTNINLYINGHACGNPVEWLEDMPNSTVSELGAYVWRKLEFIQFDNETVLFEVTDATSNLLDNYYLNLTDSDGDGDVFRRYSESMDYADGVYNGAWSTAHDIIYIMEYELGSPYEFNDSLKVEPDAIEQNMGVSIYYTIESLGFQNYINISYGGSVIDSYKVAKKLGWFVYYNTSNIGLYTVELNRSDATKASDTFKVTVSDRDWYIKFYPNPVNPASIVKCEVMFNFTAYNGTLVNTRTNEEFFCPRSKITIFTFNSGTSGIIPFKLYGTLHGTRIDHIGTENLYVGLLSLDASIAVNPRITWTKQPQRLVLSGYHNLIGTDIKIDIYINDEFIYSIPVGVSELSVFNIIWTYTGSTLGTLYFRLVYNEMVLAFDTCTVKYTSVEEDPFGLPTAYINAMFGAFITLGFLIIPFALSMKHKGSTSSVIYAIFGGIGLGVATIIGFFPLWLPLMITIIVVIILVIEYKK